jgi:hypothetical protein
MITIILIVWIAQGLLFGTILSALESLYGPFRIHPWAYFAMFVWPFLVLSEPIIFLVEKFRIWIGYD